MPENPSPEQQFGALCVLEYVSDLFTAAGKDLFTREEVLVILAAVKNDPDFFDRDVIEAYSQATAHLEGAE